MATIDLNVKAVVGLGENDSISKDKFKSYLEKFDKEDLINYLLSDVYGDSKDNDMDDELDAEDY